MPRTTAIASVSGLTAGVVLTVIVTGRPPDDPSGGLVLPILARLAPAVCALLIAGKVFRRWLDNHSAHMRREFDAAADSRRDHLAQIAAREQDVSRREAAIARSAAAREARTSQILQALVDTRIEHAALLDEHAELTAEYNRVVADSLQQAADRFRPRGAPVDGGTAPCIPLPAQPRPSDAAAEHPARDVADPLLS